MVIVDIIAGLALTYALFSLLCTTVVEWIARILTQRPKMLKSFLKDLFQDDKVWVKFQKHPCIRELSEGKGHAFPSYIPDKVFALVFLNLTVDATPDENTSFRVKDGTNERLSTLLATILAGVGSFSHALERIQQWYNESSQRITGQYTRRAHLLALIVSVVITVGLNVDSWRIAKMLNSDRDVRDRVTEQARQQPENTPVLGRIQALDLPIGWARNPFNFEWSYSQLPAKLAGWIVSMLAIQLGAPFWFDLLNRFVNLRQAAAPSKT